MTISLRKLILDKVKILKSIKILIFADATKNLYEMHPKDHEKIFRNSIANTYKKVPQKSVNLEAKRKIFLNMLTRPESLITLKDHKDHFSSNPKSCLINPSISELGTKSKSILERLNKTLVEQLKYNQ